MWILFPTAGSAHVLGLVPWEQRRTLTRRIGTLFGQRSQLWLELSPRASLQMLGAVYGMSDEAIARRIGERLRQTRLCRKARRTGHRRPCTRDMDIDEYNRLK